MEGEQPVLRPCWLMASWWGDNLVILLLIGPLNVIVLVYRKLSESMYMYEVIFCGKEGSGKVLYAKYYSIKRKRGWKAKREIKFGWTTGFIVISPSLLI